MREREGENVREKHYQLIKEESSDCLTNRVSRFFYLTFITITTITSLHLIFNNNNSIYANYVRGFNRTNATSSKEIVESCDIFKGRWIPERNASLYTDYSCKELPQSVNCFLHGRKDREFLDWKWKPDQCELPRFSAVAFLSILRGKKMAFIGDSLARNQVESLVCLLSAVETPKSIGGTQDMIWEFPEHNFTIIVFWSPFLVAATNIAGTDNFNLYLDKADTKWSEKLPFIDYAVFSSSHWFFRQNYMYEGGHVVGCTNCHMPNITDFGPSQAIRMAFRASFRAVNGCEKCKKIVTFLRSYSPGHFENESWRTDTCNQTQPVEREEVNRAGLNGECNKIQVEELETARNEGKGKGNVFDFLDITEMMAMRADGHPDRHWKNGVHLSDCLHWCLPGPIDRWNDLLLQRIKRLQLHSSSSINWDR